MGVPKFPKLGLPQTWRPITLCADLWLKWGLKKSYSPCQELFNDISHTTCTQGNQGDSWLLMVRSQIGNLTPSPSFGHSLCFKYLNGSCETILDIYVSRVFQWYKELFNPMGFDPCNLSLKVWDSNSQSGSSLGNVRVHSLAFSCTPGSMKCDSWAHSWPTPLQTLTLVTSPRLGLG